MFVVTDIMLEAIIGGDYWSSTAKVVSTEEKAIEWVNQKEHADSVCTPSVWREYTEYEVE
jgi:hypothetical protein